MAEINKPKPAAQIIYAQEIKAAPGPRKIMLDIFVFALPLILGVLIIVLSVLKIECPRGAEATSGACACKRDGE